jgi:hypothetical protein
MGNALVVGIVEKLGKNILNELSWWINVIVMIILT